jgi:hypothetical protein
MEPICSLLETQLSRCSRRWDMTRNSWYPLSSLGVHLRLSNRLQCRAATSLISSLNHSTRVDVIHHGPKLLLTSIKKLSSNSPSTTPSLQTTTTTKTTSVGIFIDLDNMSRAKNATIMTVIPHVTRMEVTRKIEALKTVGEDSFGANSIRIAAFANRNTQTYKNKKRRGIEGTHDDEDQIIRALDLQDWWQPHSHRDEYYDNDDVLEGPFVQTGYDDQGFLRCGVCGAKMKLTKKDKARGWTEKDKLDKHMKQLHDKEQAKRLTRLNQLKGSKKKKYLQGKVGMQMKKYKASQVGLDRGPTNDWFSILRENAVDCYSSEDVDTDLMKKAKKWLKKQRKEQVDNVILMVVSEDADFVPLLEHASNIASHNQAQYFPYVQRGTWAIKRNP